MTILKYHNDITRIFLEVSAGTPHFWLGYLWLYVKVVWVSAAATAHKHLPMTEHPRVQVQSDVFYRLALGLITGETECRFYWKQHPLELNEEICGDQANPWYQHVFSSRHPCQYGGNDDVLHQAFHYKSGAIHQPWRSQAAQKYDWTALLENQIMGREPRGIE